MNKLLYHGTAANRLAIIKSQGLLPRVKSKAKDNWKHTVSSNKDAVYLTTAYPWHFAACATDDDPGLILEIDRSKLLPWLLCPDEDCLEQITRSPKCVGENFAPLDWSMKKRTLFYRKHARHNPQHADTSLEYLGTAAYYEAIPWNAVTRYVLIDWDKLHPSMYIRAVDSMVSTINFRYLQDRHRAFTKWFFGDPVTAEEMLGEIMLPIQEEQAQQMGEILTKRNGLTIVSVQHEQVAA